MDARDPDRPGRRGEDQDEWSEPEAREHGSFVLSPSAGSLRIRHMKGQDKPKKLGKKVAQKSLKEKRKEKKAKKDTGSSSF